MTGGVVLALMVPHAAFASVSPTPDDTVQVGGGSVFAVAQVGDLTIIGGNFTQVGGRPRAGVAAITAEGTVDPDFKPAVEGVVYAVAASDDGSRVFLGGLFTTAGGLARSNLAAVNGDTGAGIDAWAADTTGTTPEVRDLETYGDRLFVGGKFNGIGGTTRRKLAVVDVTTAAVNTSFRPQPNGGVRGLRISPDGSTVFAGGGFTSIGGAARSSLVAEVSSTDGTATAFAPSQGGGSIISLELSPDGTRLFYSTSNNTIFAYDHDTSNSPVWLNKMSGDTQAMAATASELYIGGHFSQSSTYKIKRPFLGSLNPVDGTMTSWDPKASGPKMGVWALETTPTHVLAGGVFQYFGTDEQRGFARFSGTP